MRARIYGANSWLIGRFSSRGFEYTRVQDLNRPTVGAEFLCCNRYRAGPIRMYFVTAATDRMFVCRTTLSCTPRRRRASRPSEHKQTNGRIAKLTTFGSMLQQSHNLALRRNRK